MLVVSGTCCGFPASILLDPSFARSVVSTRFALHHNLTSASDSHSILASPVVTVPTPSGWYTSRADLVFDYVREHDVVLGSEWCRAVDLATAMVVVPDPGHAL